jgi:hypothetical protein
MQPNEVASLLGLATTLILSTVVIVSFRKAWDRFLADRSGSESLKDLIAIYTYLLVIFLPAIGVLSARPAQSTSIVIMLMDQLLWCLVGIVAAILCSAFGVGIFTHSNTFSPNTYNIQVSSHDQADDLQRLLTRVEEIRARDIVRRSGTGRN